MRSSRFSSLCVLSVLLTISHVAAEDPPSEFKIPSPDAQNSQEFGWAVSTDGRSLAVGDPYPTSVHYSCDVYVFKQVTSGDWSDVFERKFEAPAQTGYAEKFGYSVAIDGDFLAIGAPGSTACGGDPKPYGAVFLHQDISQAKDWSVTAVSTICPSDFQSGDMEFGSSLAFERGMLVVGAPGDTNTNGDYAGAVFIYRDASVEHDWSTSSEVKLIASDGAESDRFGNSVDLDGRIVVVGSASDDDNGSNSGSVYLYRDTSIAIDWGSSQEKKIVAFDGALGDQFGFDVAVSGSTLVVGAPNKYALGHLSGVFYIFQDTSEIGDWTSYEEQMLPPPNGLDGDRMGHAVAVRGDRIAVTSIAGSVEGLKSGLAYFYENESDQHDWAAYSVETLVASDFDNGDKFGSDISIGVSTIVVGANEDTNENGLNAGSAYIFLRSEPALFVDGFESGNATEWSNTVP